MEYIYEYFLEIVECKFARNGLTNWKTFLANILKNIIWHLFAGESHQVVKITVPYPALIPRNEFRQPMWPGGPVRKPYSSSVPSPHRLFKNSSSGFQSGIAMFLQIHLHIMEYIYVILWRRHIRHNQTVRQAVEYCTIYLNPHVGG